MDNLEKLQNRAKVAALRLEIAEKKAEAGKYRDEANKAGDTVTRAQCLRDVAVANAFAAELNVKMECLIQGVEYTPATFGLPPSLT